MFWCVSIIIIGDIYGMVGRDPVQVCTPLKRQRVYEPKQLSSPMSLVASPVAMQKSISRRLFNISPQQVQIPADNVARRIYKILAEGAEHSTKDAVFAILNWQQKFPMLFGKIRWFTPEDQRDEMKVDFKFKLAGALHHTILTCLAKSSYSDSVVQSTKIQENGVDICRSTLRLGGFLCTSIISKIEQRPGYSFKKINSDLVPVYKKENRIKESLKNYLFSIQDTPDFQQVLQDILSSIPVDMRVNKEQFYHALVYGMISFMGSSYSMVEVYSGEGRADMLLVSDLGDGNSRNCIIEFKFNRSAEEALQQIETMQYGKYFGSGSIIAVGINIKENPLQVSCIKKIIYCPAPVVSQVDGAARGAISWV
jgi:hypothetical protein